MSRALLVGVGGLGSPSAIVLAQAGVGHIGMADDDVVDVTNLHRQILYEEADVGRQKLVAARDRLRSWGGASLEVALHETRLYPENVRGIIRQYDVVVEGSDNFATKFMVADACALEGVPVVHGSAVRWHGTALAVGASARPCYRCLFEDIPHEYVPNCAEAGVMGPVVGVVGALQADLALALLAKRSVGGELVTFDGLTDRLRRRRIAARPDCPLCGRRSIQTVDLARYTSPMSA